MKQLGKKIRELRKLHRMTQKEFSKLATITYRHYQNIEADRANIRLSTAKEIASGLKIPLPTLFDAKHTAELLSSGVKDAWQILDLIPMGVCISNLEGRIIYLNSFFKTHLLHKSENYEAKNLFVWDLIPDEEKTQGQLDFLKVRREKPKPKSSRRAYFGPEKKKIEVLIYWDYISDEMNNPKGFVSAVLPRD